MGQVTSRSHHHCPCQDPETLIRRSSLTKKHLLLKNYVYLRDSHHKKYATAASSKAVLVEIYEQGDEIRRLRDEVELARKEGARKPAPKGDGDKGKGKNEGGVKKDDGKGKNKLCLHCRSDKLHSILSLEHHKDACPLANYTASKAKRIKSDVLAALEKKDKTLEEILKDFPT